MTNNYELSYEELLDLTNEISPHQRFLNSIMTWGMRMPKWNFTLTLWMIHLQFQNPNTSDYNLFVTDRPKTDRYGRNSIPYRANQIWNLLSRQIKNSANLDSFKLKIALIPYLNHIYRIYDVYKVEVC